MINPAIKVKLWCRGYDAMAKRQVYRAILRECDGVGGTYIIGRPEDDYEWYADCRKDAESRVCEYVTKTFGAYRVHLCR